MASVELVISAITFFKKKLNKKFRLENTTARTRGHEQLPVGKRYGMNNTRNIRTIPENLPVSGDWIKKIEIVARS